MNINEAMAWLRGDRSMTNIIANCCAGDGATRIVLTAQADAAMTQQAFFVAKAWRENSLPPATEPSNTAGVVLVDPSRDLAQRAMTFAELTRQLREARREHKAAAIAAFIAHGAIDPRDRESIEAGGTMATTAPQITPQCWSHRATTEDKYGLRLLLRDEWCDACKRSSGLRDRVAALSRRRAGALRSLECAAKRAAESAKP